jgi:hypothetical protein
MTIKGKNLKVAQQSKELSDDVLVWQYLRENIEFDTGIWYEYAHDDGVKGYLLLPYRNGYWLEDKIWFESQLKMNQFCMLCGCKIIMERF